VTSHASNPVSLFAAQGYSEMPGFVNRLIAPGRFALSSQEKQH
jgi:hypothetical protein